MSDKRSYEAAAAMLAECAAGRHVWEQTHRDKPYRGTLRLTCLICQEHVEIPTNLRGEVVTRPENDDAI